MSLSRTLQCTFAAAIPFSGTPALSSSVSDATPGVRLLGRIDIPGDAHDKSALRETTEGGTPNDRLGGFGSAIASCGSGDRFILMPDRGPRDGQDSFQCRWHEARISIDPRSEEPSFELLATHLLFTAEGRPLLGLAAGIGPQATRFDPEGVRVLPGPDGDLIVSDEYGPHVAIFSRGDGRMKRRFSTPAGFAPDHPHQVAAEELRLCTIGRVPNAGFEGLALSADGSRAYALLQGPLIQDGGNRGELLRLVEFNVADGTSTRQYLYPVEHPGYRTNEILAVRDGAFLVIERDNQKGAASSKRVYLAQLPTRTSEPPEMLPLHRDELAPGVVPLSKTLLFDLFALDTSLPSYRIPAKIEGLAFGPDLPGGEHLLLITSDNDFQAKEPSYVWAVAIAPELLKHQPPGEAEVR